MSPGCAREAPKPGDGNTIVAPWVAALLVAIFVPLSLASGAVLFATLVAKAVTAGAFEVPVALRTAESGERITLLVNLKRVKRGKDEDPILHKDDVVLVPESFF